MFDLTRHPRLFRPLALWDRARAKLRRGGSSFAAAETSLNADYREIWESADAACGARVELLGNGVLEIRRGSFSTRVIQNTSAIDDLVTHLVVRTKPLVYRMLARSALPTPDWLAFDMSDLQSAADFLTRHPDGCVVKPASGTGGGAGVTTNVSNRWTLARAAYNASRFGSELMIEQQMEGDNYRLLYLDGELIDAIRRDPPAAVADGTSSVLALVQQINRERARRAVEASHTLLTIDLDMRNTLARQGLSLRSVSAKGTRIILKTAINENGAAENVTVMNEVCDSIIRAGAEAANMLGVRLAGVDIITRDITVPFQQSGGVVLEVNCPPGFYWHYHKRDGSFPVAEHVLHRLLANEEQSVPRRQSALARA